MTGGAGGAVWFTEETDNQIGRITADGVITEFPIPTASTGLTEITQGPDGALWFVASSKNIGRITTDGVITEFQIPTTNSGPAAITMGPDGALWLTEADTNQIARITTDTGIPESAGPTAGSS